MKEKRMKGIIDEYIKAYNKFDLDGMMKNLSIDIVFKNITNGETTLELNGKYAFKSQVEQAFNLFKNREMKIIDQKFGDDTVENTVDFKGVLDLDIPDGPKKYDLIKLQSKSIFQFKDGKIILIEDIT